MPMPPSVLSRVLKLPETVLKDAALRHVHVQQMRAVAANYAMKTSQHNFESPIWQREAPMVGGPDKTCDKGGFFPRPSQVLADDGASKIARENTNNNDKQLNQTNFDASAVPSSESHPKPVNPNQIRFQRAQRTTGSRSEHEGAQDMASVENSEHQDLSSAQNECLSVTESELEEEDAGIEAIVSSETSYNKPFEGIPASWHKTIKVFN